VVMQKYRCRYRADGRWGYMVIRTLLHIYRYRYTHTHTRYTLSIYSTKQHAVFIPGGRGERGGAPLAGPWAGGAWGGGGGLVLITADVRCM
jgi:hypothetical protein